MGLGRGRGQTLLDAQRPRSHSRALRGGRDSTRSETATCVAFDLLPGIGESAHVLSKEARGVHQRGERCEIAGAGVQAKEVEAAAGRGVGA